MTQDREFWIRVQGGLCNRMRTLASGIGYAEVTGRRLRVCWPTTPRFQITTPSGIRSFPWVRRYPAESRFEAEMGDLWENQFDSVSPHVWQERLKEHGGLSFPPPRPDSANASPVLMLETCHDFFSILPQSAQELYARLRLRCNLARRITAVEQQMTSARPCIGVHLRCVAPHDRTAEFFKPEWFHERICTALKKWPDARIFLVTDSPKAADFIRRAFPGRTIEQNPVNGFNTRKAIQKALVDVHLLSRTDYILGSYFSSMSYLSADMQGRGAYEDTHHRWGDCPAT
jgi:hypothetical protein